MIDYVCILYCSHAFNIKTCSFRAFTQMAAVYSQLCYFDDKDV